MGFYPVVVYFYSTRRISIGVDLELDFNLLKLDFSGLFLESVSINLEKKNAEHRFDTLRFYIW